MISELPDLDFATYDVSEQRTNIQILRDKVKDIISAFNTQKTTVDAALADILTYGSGAPGSSVTSKFFLDETNDLLYVRYQNGTYKSVLLT